MRGLAGALVRDPAAADDLVQETWLAAVRNPRASQGEASATSQPWLSTVLRNAAKQWRRSKARRSRHELEATSRGEPEVGSAVHSVEQLELRRALIDAVLALPEAQRDAITLRYLDELPPRRIAARLAVPVATVHTRIERGLSRLRQQLDQRHGSRSAWTAPWLVWCSAAPIQPVAATTGMSAWIGFGIMSAKTKIAWSLATGVMASSLVYWLLSGPPPVPNELSGVTGTPTVRSATANQADEVGGDTGGRHGAAEATAQRAEAESLEPVERVEDPERVVRGQVLGLDGTPLPRVGVRASSHHHELAASPAGGSPEGGRLEDRKRTNPPLVTVRTDASGKFELATEDRSGFLVVDEPGWATVYAGDLRGESGEVIVIAARGRSLRGVVRSSDGQPIGAVAVSVAVDQSLRARLDRVLDRSHDASWSVRTDAAGRFDFGSLPRLAEATVAVRHLGHAGWQRPLGELPADVVIELKRPEAITGVVRGLVLDASSRPVPNAWVGAGAAMTRTEADGTFQLSRHRLGDATSMTAVAKGWRPARMTRPGGQPQVQRQPDGQPDGQPGGSPESWPDYVEFRLEARALELSGRVVDANGKGLAGARVWVVDGTPVGAHGGRPIVLEGVSGGVPRVDEIRQKMDPGLDAAGMRERINRSPSMVWGFVSTDTSGAFRLTGLMDREYRVAALDPVTLVSTERAATRAGQSHIELLLPTGKTVRRLRGRVVAADGQPIAGVVVRASKIVAHVALASDTSWMRSARADAQSVTDADGRFELTGVPRADVSIGLEGDAILPDSYSIDQVAATRGPSSTDDEWSGVELQASRRYHVQAVVADPTRGNRVAVLNAAGEMLTLTVFFGAGSRMMDEFVPLHQGKSAAFVVSEAATTLVLFDGKREVVRTRLELTAGQLNRVEL